MNTPRPINVYAELTPNPNSMKFVSNVLLLEGGTVEYSSREEAVNCPMAVKLFEFSGVKKIFITSNFITITKENDLDWYDLTNIFREFIRGFLMDEDQLFIGSPFDKNHIPTQTNAVQEAIKPIAIATENEKANEEIIFDPEAEKKIIELLDEYVRPAVEGDGGAILFKSYENGVVNVVMKGACNGCPSSTVTLKSGIENLLKQMVPGVKEVVAVGE